MKKPKINIKQLRRRYDISLQELAEDLGFDEQQLSEIENEGASIDSPIYNLLHKRYPKINLHEFIEDQGNDFEQLTEEGSDKFQEAQLLSTHATEEMLLLREGKHEQAAIRFFQKINKTSWPSMQRIYSSDRFVYRFDERSYLVVASNELEQVAKEQVSRCLWISPEPVLRLFLPDSDKKEAILIIASSFRSNYKKYGSVMVPNLYPEAATFNRFLESVVADKVRLIDSVLETFSYEQILSTTDHICYEEIVYEGESYRIFDVTI